NGKDAGGIGYIDTDDRFFRQGMVRRPKQGEGQSAAARGIDDEIGRKRFGYTLAIPEAYSGDDRAILCCQHLLHPASLAQRHICPDLSAPITGKLDRGS